MLYKGVIDFNQANPDSEADLLQFGDPAACRLYYQKMRYSATLAKIEIVIDRNDAPIFTVDRMPAD